MQLVIMNKCEFLQQRFTARRNQEMHDAAVFGPGLPLQQPTIGKAVGEFDNRVMTDMQPPGKIGNRRRKIRRQAFQGKQQLVLLRLNACSLGGFFAEVKERSDLMPEFGEELVVDSFLHATEIISPCDTFL